MSTKNLNIDLNRTVTVKHAANLLNVSEKSVQNYCKLGYIENEKIDGRLNIKLQSLFEFRGSAIDRYKREELHQKIVNIIEQCNYLGKLELNFERKSFKPNIQNKIKGQCVYFIVQFINGEIDFSEDNVLIQKIGKADGEYGLQRRMSDYTGDNVNVKRKDKTLEKMYNVFVENFIDKSIHIFYMPVMTIRCKIFGDFQVDVSPAREIEKLYSYYARAQNHPLLLSSFD